MLGVRQGDRRAAVGGERDPAYDRRLERWVFVVALVLLLLPFVITAPRLIGRAHPAIDGDNALIELKVRDVGGAHTPLVGSYQRFGFNQPGPLLFYVLAVPYRILGSRFSGIQIGALCINSAAVVSVLAVARRRAGAVGVAGTALVLALAVHGFGPHGIANAWEPRIVVFPLVALVVAAADVLAGGRWSLVTAVAFASLVAEAYASIAFVAVILVLIAFVVAIAHAGRARRTGRALAGPVVAAFAVGVVLWIPPLVDAIVHHPSNLRRTVDFVRAGNPVSGLRAGYRMVALQLDHRASWLRDHVPLSPLTSEIAIHDAPVVPWALVALVLAAALAWWRGARRVLALALAAFVMLGAFVFVYSRLVGPLYIWLQTPSRAAGAVTWLAVGACAYAAARGVLRARERALALVAAVLVTVSVTVVTVHDSFTDHVTGTHVEASIAALADDSAASLHALHGPVTVHSDVAAIVFGASQFGRDLLIDQLARRGVAVVVDHTIDDVVRFGSWRAHPERAVAEVRLVAAPSGFTPPAGAQILARVDPLTPSQRALRTTTSSGKPASPEDLRKLADQAAHDPALRRLLEALRKIPNLPPLALLLITPAR